MSGPSIRASENYINTHSQWDNEEGAGVELPCNCALYSHAAGEKADILIHVFVSSVFIHADGKVSSPTFRNRATTRVLVYCLKSSSH